MSDFACSRNVSSVRHRGPEAIEWHDMKAIGEGVAPLAKVEGKSADKLRAQCIAKPRHSFHIGTLDSSARLHVKSDHSTVVALNDEVHFVAIEVAPVTHASDRFIPRGLFLEFADSEALDDVTELSRSSGTETQKLFWGDSKKRGGDGRVQHVNLRLGDASRKQRCAPRLKPVNEKYSLEKADVALCRHGSEAYIGSGARHVEYLGCLASEASEK